MRNVRTNLCLAAVFLLCPAVFATPNTPQNPAADAAKSQVLKLFSAAPAVFIEKPADIASPGLPASPSGGVQS